MRIGSVIVVAPVVAVGCGGGAAVEEYSAVDSAGVRVVTNPGAVVELALTEALRIGVQDGDERFQFFRISAVAMDGAGNYFVADRGSASIRVFAADGAFIRQIGGRGGGPGEFENLFAVWVRPDEVLALSSGRGPPRFSWFTPTGEFVGSRSYRRADNAQLAPIGSLGSWWTVLARHDPDPQGLTPGRLHIDSLDVAFWDADSDSLRMTALRFPDEARIVTPGGELMAGPLFNPIPSVATDGRGRIYRTSGTEFEIEIFGDGAGPTARIRRLHEPRPIQQEWIDAYAVAVTEFYQSVPDYPTKQAEIRRVIDGRTDAIQVDRLPPTGALIVAPSGAVWIERRDLDPDPWQREFARSFGRRAAVPPAVWEVFAATGRYLGTVALPAQFRPYVATDRSIIGVLQDTLDVEYVVRYAVKGLNRQ